MSFLFKSSKKSQQERALNGSRDITGAASGPHPPPGPVRAQTEKPTRATPTGSLSSIGDEDASGSPNHPPHMSRRNTSVDHTMTTSGQPNDVAKQFRNAPLTAQPPSSGAAPNASLYPWSQRRLTLTSSHPSPFPRYGAAANSLSSKEGDIYVMGGLVNSSTVRGDLWMVEAGGNMACYPLTTTSEAPSPRVGHACLLVGNAFIVYGGDTKVEENDVLDETLYLLNTSSRQWSRVLPAGVRPSGRYGHSLNILGSKIYIFGGQVDGYFMNDLAAFDLNTLQMPNNRWEMLIQSSPDAPAQNAPAPRTNHTVITFNDKMYLFGGTNGYQWFNDVWCYDPVLNKWAQLDCIGYIPVAREGHAAALVDDVMYVFGGRTEEGNDLGDLAAFRITSRRWYTFQNMGPSPSARSGHSMTAVQKSVVVLGGEPSTPGASTADLGLVYVLDTTKIRYPNDSQGRGHGGRRPSADSPSGSARQPQVEQKKLINGPTNGPTNGPNHSPSSSNSPTMAARSVPDSGGGGNVGHSAQLGPGPKATPPSTGPSPPGPAPTKPASNIGRTRGPSIERDGAASSVPAAANQSSPALRQQQQQRGAREESPASSGAPRGPPTQQNAARQGSRDRSGSVVDSTKLNLQQQQQQQQQQQLQQQQQQQQQQQPQQQRQQQVSQQTVQPPQSPKQPPPQTPPQAPQPQTQSPRQRPAPQVQEPTRQPRSQDAIDSSSEVRSPTTNSRPSSPPVPGPQARLNPPLNRRSSGRNSQTVALLKELDTSRIRNAWYASELELARKAGYTPNTTLSPALESRAAETFDDEDKTLIEALFAMRAELAKVQAAVDKQAYLAARQVAEAEAQRDAAIHEAVYAKAKLAALSAGAQAGTQAAAGGGSPHPDADSAPERSNDLARKLAAALHAQRELQLQLEGSRAELDSERRARILADDTAESMQKRTADLEAYKQQHSAEIDALKRQLHETAQGAREQAVARAEAAAALELVRAEKAELEARYQDAVGGSRDHGATIASLREALASSAESAEHIENRLAEERGRREEVEARLAQLRAEHESRAAELDSASQRLRDAQELAEKHAKEAKAHRQAVLNGLDKLSARNAADKSTGTLSSSVGAAGLQEQLAVASALARKHQQETDAAEAKVRLAEERIFGLEAYMESTSREGVATRKQLQSTMREIQALQAANSELKRALAAQQLETNAVTIQHNTLKDILSERGISPTTSASRARGGGGSGGSGGGGLNSPRTVGSPEHQKRLHDLEQQLMTAVEAHEDTRRQLTLQLDESEVAYREKLAQLENDYQSAVHYVKGTERMLKQLQDQLSRFKAENERLNGEVDRLSKVVASGPAAAGAPGDWERQRGDLEAELSEARRDRDAAVQSSELAAQKLASSRRELEQLQQLQQENAHLEQRVQDAENKVSLLLDQVESSVDNYRRLSHQPPSVHSDLNGGGGGGGPHAPGHMRNESSETESVYGPATAATVAATANARNSTALDSLASELETLRSHWETTNKNYRLSNAFDFEGGGGAGERKDEGMAD